MLHFVQHFGGVCEEIGLNCCTNCNILADFLPTIF